MGLVYRVNHRDWAMNWPLSLQGRSSFKQGKHGKLRARARVGKPWRASAHVSCYYVRVWAASANLHELVEGAVWRTGFDHADFEGRAGQSAGRMKDE